MRRGDGFFLQRSADARRGDIAANDMAAALVQFHQELTGLSHRIEITPALVLQTMILAATHALRGYDAIQLAAAVAVNARGVSPGLPVLTLMSADEERNAAATIAG